MVLKKLFYLVLGVVVLAGCHKDGSDDLAKEVLTLDEHRFDMSAEGGSLSVNVTCNVKYAVTIPDNFRSWLSEEESEVAGTHDFAVSANEEPKVREGYVLFSGNSLTDTVRVVQACVGKDFADTVSGVSFDMVYVKGGTFLMGATEEQGADYDNNELPVHSVTLSDYYIGKHEVTQKLWTAVMGNNPSNFKEKEIGDNYPVENVSWNDIQAFIIKLNELTGKKYTLPTEAQWEYAARGGVENQGYKYSGSNDIDEVAWYWENSKERYPPAFPTSPVGTKEANELGIYDMSGNVWEWCQDWSGDYNSEAQSNPAGPETGSFRILRGGGWALIEKHCRVSYRCGSEPGNRGSCYGFRIALQP